MGIWLSTVTAGAQASLPDSSSTFTHSTVLKTRPMAMVMGNITFAVEQTVGKQSSVELEGSQFIPLWRDLRAIGQVQSVSASFHYYPLAHQTAPAGFYVGSKVSYGRLKNSSFLGFISLLTTASIINEVSFWSAQGLVGYQHCSRRNLILNIQGGLNFLHRITYYETRPPGQPAVERHTNAGQFIPSVTLSIGYRFRHHRN